LLYILLFVEYFAKYSHMTHPPSGKQIRAGRSLLGWSLADLARAAGKSPGTIARLEAREAVHGTMWAVLAALEEKGVVFVDGGVALRRENGS
jgi:transcriptional regulator with XRE-family HTH domain